MSAARMRAPVSSGVAPTLKIQPTFCALDLKQVVALTRLSKAHIYGLIAQGLFPVPAKVCRRSIWDSREVENWLDARFAERGLA